MCGTISPTCISFCLIPACLPTFPAIVMRPCMLLALYVEGGKHLFKRNLFLFAFVSVFLSQRVLVFVFMRLICNALAPLSRDLPRVKLREKDNQDLNSAVHHVTSRPISTPSAMAASPSSPARSRMDAEFRAYKSQSIRDARVIFLKEP